MRGRTRVILGVAGIAAVALLVYLSQWGRLFPYSPVALGFARHELPHVVVLVENGAEFSDFARLDTLIPRVESFHELRFHHKPRLYFFRDSASYVRRSPSRARFYTCVNGNVVISPWAVREDKEGTISLATYLRHELSHSLLSQNMDILAAYRYPKWLLEGIAVYSADQMGTSWYPSKAETYALVRRGNYMPPDCFKTRREDRIKLDVPYRMTFMYSEFGCIVGYLVESYGRNRLLEYMKRLCKTSGHKGAFEDVFGVGFDTFINQFKEHVSSTTVPAPAVQHGRTRDNHLLRSDVQTRDGKMVELVEPMLKLHKELPRARTPHDKEFIERQISATDRGTETLPCAQGDPASPMDVLAVANETRYGEGVVS